MVWVFPFFRGVQGSKEVCAQFSTCSDFLSPVPRMCWQRADSLRYNCMFLFFLLCRLPCAFALPCDRHLQAPSRVSKLDMFDQVEDRPKKHRQELEAYISMDLHGINKSNNL